LQRGSGRSKIKINAHHSKLTPKVGASKRSSQRKPYQQ
jgi:hypothetical protein